MTLRTFKQHLIRFFAPELHFEYQRLTNACQGLQLLLSSSRQQGLKDRARVRHLWRERAELTEIISSLVAKDDSGDWTTVFDADTRLPDAYQVQLNVLVNRA